MSSRQRRCASTGRAASKTRGGPCCAATGWRCRKKAWESWYTTCTASGIIDRAARQATASPHGLARPLRPLAVIGLAPDRVGAHGGEDLAGRRQALGIDALVGIPQIGTDDGARTLEI